MREPAELIATIAEQEGDGPSPTLRGLYRYLLHHFRDKTLATQALQNFLESGQMIQIDQAPEMGTDEETTESSVSD